jgi:3-methylfumaryl-CoA hydratase
VAGELVRRFRATFDEDPEGAPRGTPAPLCIHWCLAPPVARRSALGVDGHPARGGFLPPVALPRRMWAGGALEFHDRLLVGDKCERVSRITGVEAKNGRTGALCFVTVEHQLSTERGPAIVERHDIVYRGESAAARGQPAPAVEGARREDFPTDATLLFRYSALTFNGHRIHYDPDYAKDQEGYPGLVVHGPLQATRLVRLAADMLGRPPARFAFRGVSPLILGRGAVVCGVEGAEGLELWMEDGQGARTMTATAR